MSRSMSHPVHLWLACTLVIACTDNDGQGGDATDGGPPLDDPTSLTLPPGVFITDGTSDDPGEKLDLPGGGGTGPVDDTGLSPKGCAKVDFLFVIDNSNSMADEQSSLIASFPGFIAAIEETLTADDYHIMAISTDDGYAGDGDEECGFGVDDCICAPAPTCCQDLCDSIFADDRSCNGTPCDGLTVDSCEFQYGSGRQYDQTGKRCPIAAGRRYMLADQPNIESTFACAAGIGVWGSGDERPMQSVQAALGAAQNGPGGCNEGFLRDDAILVLVLITDEEDDNIEAGEGSPGEPAGWYEAVVAAKRGIPDAAVVLGLVGDGNLPGGLCSPVWDPDVDGGQSAPRLQSFVQKFPLHVLGSVCSADYTPFLLEAVGVIDTACDSFVPVG